MPAPVGTEKCRFWVYLSVYPAVVHVSFLLWIAKKNRLNNQPAVSFLKNRRKTKMVYNLFLTFWRSSFLAAVVL